MRLFPNIAQIGTIIRIATGCQKDTPANKSYNIHPCSNITPFYNCKDNKEYCG